MLNKKDLNILEGLFMLAAINNFGGKRRTSEAWGTSIDTINKYIENLESNLGLKLIYSNDRGSKLTVDGLMLIKKMLKIKESLYDIYAMSGKHGELRGEVRVAMSFGVRAVLPAEKFINFAEKYPELLITSVFSDDDPDMRNHSFDLGLCYEVPPNSGLVLISRKKIPCGFFAAPDYLSRRGYPEDCEDMLSNHNVLLRNKGVCQSGVWKEFAKNMPHTTYQSNSVFDLIDLVRAGFGIGIMPLALAGDGLVCLENIACDINLHFNLVAHQDTKDVPKNRVVIDFFKELLDEL